MSHVRAHSWSLDVMPQNSFSDYCILSNAAITEHDASDAFVSRAHNGTGMFVLALRTRPTQAQAVRGLEGYSVMVHDGNDAVMKQFENLKRSDFVSLLGLTAADAVTAEDIDNIVSSRSDLALRNRMFMARISGLSSCVPEGMIDEGISLTDPSVSCHGFVLVSFTLGSIPENDRFTVLATCSKCVCPDRFMRHDGICEFLFDDLFPCFSFSEENGMLRADFEMDGMARHRDVQQLREEVELLREEIRQIKSSL